MNSFQVPRAVRMTIVAIAGRDMGRAMLQNTRTRLAPSAKAASSIS